MMKEDKVMLNDEEMDNVSGGWTTLTCEIKYSERKQAYYVRVHNHSVDADASTFPNISISDSTINVGLDRIQEYFDRYPGADIIGKDGKAFSIPKDLV